MSRIIIAIDGDDAETPEALYLRIHTLLGNVPTLEWESTDEWYGVDGEPLTEQEVSDTRMRVFSHIHKLTESN